MHLTNNAPRRLYVLVHPGSLCGSANFNIGRGAARAAREAVIGELRTWQGDILVIDSTFSDELAYYPMLNTAISNAVARAEADGRLALRMVGCDEEPPHQDDIARAVSVHLKGLADAWQITASGAWYDSSDREGCVNSVATAFRAADLAVIVSENAARLDCGDDAEADETNTEAMAAFFRNPPAPSQEGN